MGCCTSSATKDTENLPERNRRPADNHESSELTKSAEAANEAMVIIDLREDRVVCRDISVMQGVTVSSVEHPVADLQGHTQTPGATLSAAEQTPRTEHEAAATQTPTSAKKGGKKKKSLTMPQPHVQSGSSIGPDRDAKRRAHTMTESMAKKKDSRYWATDLKG